MKKGDKVVFSLGREKGVIINVRPNKMVEVEMEIGMNVLVHHSEIAIDFSVDELHQKPIKTNKFYIEKTKTKSIKKPTKDVDLHFSPAKIIELNTKHVLSAQLDLLSKALNQAIADGTKEFIIIHGVGEGVLKKAVHDFLKTHRLVKSFSAADFSKYGDGATKVNF